MMCCVDHCIDACISYAPHDQTRSEDEYTSHAPRTNFSHLEFWITRVIFVRGYARAHGPRRTGRRGAAAYAWPPGRVRFKLRCANGRTHAKGIEKNVDERCLLFSSRGARAMPSVLVSIRQCGFGPLRSSGGQAEHSAAAELRAAPPEGRRGTAPPPGHHGYPLPRRAAQLSEAVAIFLDVFTAADSEKRFVIEVSIPTALLF